MHNAFSEAHVFGSFSSLMMGCMLRAILSCSLQGLIRRPRKTYWFSCILMLHLAFSWSPSLLQLKWALTTTRSLNARNWNRTCVWYQRFWLLRSWLTSLHQVWWQQILLDIYLFGHFFAHMLMILWRPIQLVRECTKLESDRQKPVSILHNPSVTILYKGSTHLAISITRYSDFIQTINLQPEKNWMSKS